MDDPPPESLFRASKRRKVFRKRATGDDEDAVRPEDTTTVGDSGQDAEQAPSVVRRPAAKKQGVLFSTAGSQTAPSNAVAGETALVPFSSEKAESDEAAQNERFMKPTGRADVVEDKHLTAYVDSKLAELRSSTATLTQNTSERPGPESSPTPTDLASQQVQYGRTGSNLDQPGRDSSSRQRGGYPYGTRDRNTKPRRQPYTRDEESLARDAMIDQILQESEVPLYDRASSAAQASSKSGFDADETAAEAFKAEFLANLEEQNRRKPPAPPANAKAAQTAPTGPKLGGSRAQREKMRALEEAKNAAKK